MQLHKDRMGGDPLLFTISTARCNENHEPDSHELVREGTYMNDPPPPNEHTSEGGRDDRGVPYHAESTLSSAQVLKLEYKHPPQFVLLNY